MRVVWVSKGFSTLGRLQFATKTLIIVANLTQSRAASALATVKGQLELFHRFWVRVVKFSCSPLRLAGVRVTGCV